MKNTQKAYMPTILSTLACLVNEIPCSFHVQSLVTPQEEIEDFIKECLMTKYNQTITKETSGLIFTTLTSLLCFMSIPGSFLGSHLSNSFGRKNVIFLVGPLFMVLGSVVVCLAFPLGRVELLFIGRILCGLSFGISGTVLPVYTAEISPPELRGALISVYCAATGVGLCLGGIAGLPELLGTRQKLPCLHLAPAICAALSFVCYPWAIESPRYTCIKENDMEKARDHLRHLGVPEEIIDGVMEEFQRESQEEGEFVGFFAALKKPFYRGTILFSMCFCVFSLCWGMTGLFSLSTCLVEFLANIGMNHTQAQYVSAFIFGPMDMIACTVSIIPVHFMKRKLILLITLITIFLTLVGIFVLLFLENDTLDANSKLVPYTVLILYIILIVSDDLGPGALTVVIPPEISPTEIRSITSGVANISRLLAQGFGTLYYYPLYLWIGPYALLPLMLVVVGEIFLTIFILPETKGLTIEESVVKWKNSWENSKLCCH